MAEVIRMPKMSDTMEEGVIASWLKKVGDTVQAGNIIAEVETDKATMELEAYEEGTLLHIGVLEKEAVAINGVIAIIGKPGEDIAALLAEIKQASTIASVTAIATVPTPAAPQSIPATPIAQAQLIQSTTLISTPSPTMATTPERLFASPLAKKMAQDQGYELAQIQGTGEAGRIIKRDIEQLLASGQPKIKSLQNELAAMALQEAYEDIPISQMRKTIAKRLSDSKLTAPEFYLTIDIDLDQLVAARPKLNDYASVKITFNDFIIKAVAMAIKQHPPINTAWLGNTIRYNKHIHIGVAMAVEAGLLVPVVRFANHKSLSQIAAEVKEISQKAHNNQLQPADWEGSTFTISNLGMLGIESFTAILNPPAACILAIGAIKQVPVIKQNAVVPGHIMKATLTCDHRVVDGAVGAAFLNTLKELLEDPLRLLV
jgi:pyruvate dehydrogenase E2 component (dihydrolipoamide acetyltransferase)